MRGCGIPDCDKPHLARGWCNKHYWRWHRNGDPFTRSKPRKSIAERFWAKVEFTPSCWLWTGSCYSNGYGDFSNSRGQKHIMAHRWAYEFCNGPIPPGLPLDHLCCNHPCVRPDHLEPVTVRENARRGIRGRQVACKHGHPYDLLNTYYRPEGRRMCRTCRNAAVRKSQRRKANWNRHLESPP